MITATDLDNHFVEVPTRTGARTAAAKIARNQSAELQEPASNRFVRNIDAALGQGETVGNGSFSARTTMMSAGLTVYFGG